MKNALINIYQKKIEESIIKEGDVEKFRKKNPNLNSFITNSNVSTIASHQLTITEDDYQTIISHLNQKYTTDMQNTKITDYQITNNQITDSQITDKNIDKPKIKTKTKPNKISGFVDGLIIAFITGAFIGIILLNIYSKIVQHI